MSEEMKLIDSSSERDGKPGTPHHHITDESNHFFLDNGFFGGWLVPNPKQRDTTSRGFQIPCLQRWNELLLFMCYCRLLPFGPPVVHPFPPFFLSFFLCSLSRSRIDGTCLKGSSMPMHISTPLASAKEQQVALSMCKRSTLGREGGKW